MIKKCEWCHKDFSIVPARLKTARFCSIRCYHNWATGKPGIKTGSTLRCKNCGKNYWCINSRVPGSHFCSRKCQQIYRKESGMYLGSGNPSWNGGRKIHQGYVMVYRPKHPGNIKGYIFEHRLVAELKLGRLLTKNEIVHHKDCNKQNNNPDNLVVLAHDNPTHPYYLTCPHCGERLYE